jgi:hypothetical protein
MSILKYFNINYVNLIYNVNFYLKSNFKHNYSLFYIYKYVFTTFKNTIQSNLLISLKYRILMDILKITTFKTSSCKLNYEKPTNYLISLQTTSIVFYKNKYNQLVYFFLNILLSSYLNLTTNFKLTVQYLPLNQNLNLLKFINLYYFKIRNV